MTQFPHDPILPSSPLESSILQIQSHSEVLGVKTSAYEFWGHNSALTVDDQDQSS